MPRGNSVNIFFLKKRKKFQQPPIINNLPQTIFRKSPRPGPAASSSPALSPHRPYNWVRLGWAFFGLGLAGLWAWAQAQHITRSGPNFGPCHTHIDFGHMWLIVYSKFWSKNGLKSWKCRSKFGLSHVTPQVDRMLKCDHYVTGHSPGRINQNSTVLLVKFIIDS